MRRAGSRSIRFPLFPPLSALARCYVVLRVQFWVVLAVAKVCQCHWQLPKEEMAASPPDFAGNFAIQVSHVYGDAVVPQHVRDDARKWLEAFEITAVNSQC